MRNLPDNHCARVIEELQQIGRNYLAIYQLREELSFTASPMDAFLSRMQNAATLLFHSNHQAAKAITSLSTDTISTRHDLLTKIKDIMETMDYCNGTLYRKIAGCLSKHDQSFKSALQNEYDWIEQANHRSDGGEKLKISGSHYLRAINSAIASQASNILTESVELEALPTNSPH